MTLYKTREEYEEWKKRYYAPPPELSDWARGTPPKSPGIYAFVEDG